MPAIPPVDESARVRASLALVSSALLGSRRLRAHAEATHRLPDRRGVALALRGCAIPAAEPPCGDLLLDPGILEPVCRGQRGGAGRYDTGPCTDPCAAPQDGSDRPHRATGRRECRDRKERKEED